MALTQLPPQPQAREPIVRAPTVVFLSILLLIAIHAATAFLSDDARDALIEQYGLVPAHLQAVDWSQIGFNATTFWLVVPFFSYALLHGSWMHLAFNGLAFLIFGTVVARRIGVERFLALSVVTSLAAILTHLACNWGDASPVIGASGAIAGYMGAATRFMFFDPNNPPTGPGHRLPLLSRPVLTFTIVWTVINVGVGVTGFSPGMESQDLTAWQAHLGGFFAGLLLFPVFDQRRAWLNGT